MKKMLTVLISLFCFFTSRAQPPDSSDIAASRLILQQKHEHVLQQYRDVNNSLSELKQEYSNRKHDSSFRERMTVLKQERWKWKGEYELIRKEKSAFNKKQEAFDVAMFDYYRTQPFFKYRNKSKWNLALGVGMVSAGGAVLLAGLGTGMAESPGSTATADAGRQRKENVIVATCLITGISLALGSIPFFKAASKNKARFKKHIAWNLKFDPVVLPGGSREETVGFSLRIPLFQKTGPRY